MIKSSEQHIRDLGVLCGSQAILAFKWLPWSPSILYDLLLGVVLLCSVATGYLDSALLSLCSQYSSKMQAYLQIGLGYLGLQMSDVLPGVFPCSFVLGHRKTSVCSSRGPASKSKPKDLLHGPALLKWSCQDLLVPANSCI